MSKKLIAVASAAALALTALVGVAPASANGAIAITGNAGGAGTTASPYTIAVPSNNTIQAGVNAVTVTISGLATGDVVRVDSTGGFKLLTSLTGLASTASALINVTTLGTTTYSETTTSNSNIVLYAYTTGVATGTIASSLTRTGLSSTNSVSIKGTAGPAYNMSTVSGVPTTLASGATAAITFTATDVFGNPVENSALVTAMATRNVGGFGTITWDSTAKVYKSTLTSAASDAFVWGLAFAAADVVGFAKSKASASGVVNYAGDATLAAQVATLIADYNALATKYNKLVKKSKRVAKK
jgi:hypothetical protein